MPDCHIFLSYFGVFKLAPRSGTGLLQLLRVLPSFLPSFLLCQQLIKYRSVLYDVNQCYQIPILHAAYAPRSFPRSVLSVYHWREKEGLLAV